MSGDGKNALIGTHLLVDLYDIDAPRLCDGALLAACLDAAARRSGLTPLGPPVLHHFAGGGVTGFILLAESHIALHTYPERRYMALDVFSCGATARPHAAILVFQAALQPTRTIISEHVRGGEVGT